MKISVGNFSILFQQTALSFDLFKPLEKLRFHVLTVLTSMTFYDVLVLLPGSLRHVFSDLYTYVACVTKNCKIR